MKNKNLGFTLIEIMITLVIFITISAMSVFTIRTYLPKHRLLDSLDTTEQTLSRAGMEATSRSAWTCVSYNSSTKLLSLYVDTNGNHASSASGCGDGTDLLLTTQEIRSGVNFAPSGNSNCSGTGAQGAETSFSFASPAWFDTAGTPKACSSGTCSSTFFSIIVSNDDLPSGIKAREIEVLSSGLINIVDRNNKGYMDGVFAKSGTLTSGCE